VTTSPSRRLPALVDGELVPGDRPATVSVLDAGFRTGWGVFTTLRARGSDAPLLERHAARLAVDADAVGIAAAPADLVAAVRTLLAVERHVDEVVVRATLTAGAPVDADAWPQVPQGRATLVITLHTAPPLPAPAVRAVTHTARRWPAALKSTSYLTSVLATRDARAAGADVAVLCDGDELLETAEGNLFTLVDGGLRTPAPDGRLLPGITREVVIAVADDLGIPVSVGPVHHGDVARSQALLVTSSVAGIRTVSALDGRPLPDGAERLVELVALRERVHAELGAAPSASGTSGTSG